MPTPASDINFVTNQIVANIAVVALGSNGAMDIYNPIGYTNVIVDVLGYYSAKTP